MKIYHYDSSTGAFTGTSETDPNPRRAGSFLIPAFATEVEPPQVSSEQVACWNGAQWEIKDVPKQEAPKITWDQIRMKRNALISHSDWVMFEDAKVSNKEAWLTYRQALRDLPQDFRTPEEVVWPSKPE